MPVIYTQKSIALARLLELAMNAVKWIFVVGRRHRTGNARDYVVVLIEPFQMGDVLSLAVMMDPLLGRFPQCKIVVWCHERNRKVFEADTRVWRVVCAQFFWSNRGNKRGTVADWVSIIRSVREVRALGAEVGFDTRGEIRSQILLCLGGCKRRIGSHVYLSSNMLIRGLLLTDVLDTRGVEHRFEKNLLLLSVLLGECPSLQLPAITRMNAETISSSAEDLRKIVVFHIGAGWEFRRWDSKCWTGLIDRLTCFKEIRIILLEGPGESEVNDAVTHGLARPVERRATSFSEMISVISSASLFVGLDSGPLHIACLMGIPSIALFGPGDVSLWRPLGPGGKVIHHTEGYDCHPCLQKVCVRPNDPCIAKIGVDEVYESIQNSLALKS